MSVKKIEILDEDKFPRAVRRAINMCIRRLNREVKYVLSNDGALTESRTEETEEQVLVILPRTRSTAAAARTPLMLIDASDGTAKAGVTAGTVALILVDGTQTVAVSDGDTVWLEFALDYEDTLNEWSISGLTGMSAGTFPSLPFPIDTTYLPLGTVTVDADVSTPSPTQNGSQTWIRTGNVDSWTDYFSDGS